MEWIILAAIIVASFVVSQLTTPKPRYEDARPAGLGDFNFPTTDASRHVPEVYGEVRIKAPNILWYGDLRTQPIKEKVSGGGIFDHKKHVITGYRYYLGIQFGLCKGPIDEDFLQIIVGERMIYDGPVPVDGAIIDEPGIFGARGAGGAGGMNARISAYPGTPDQAVNAYLANFQKSLVGTERTPAYVDEAYIVFEGGYHGDSPFLQPWSANVRRIPNGLGLATPWVHMGVIGPDGKRAANCANVIYELLVDPKKGRNISPLRINVPSFVAAAEQLFSERNGFAGLVTTATEIEKLLNELERQIDGRIVDNPATGLIELRLMRDDYDINTVPEIKKGTNIVKIERFTRANWADTVNDVSAEYVDSAQDYTNQQVGAQDGANAQIQGALNFESLASNPVVIRYPFVMDRHLAKDLATRELRKLSVPLSRATVIVTRELWATLPCDVLALTDETLGITRLAMRVIQVDHDDPRTDTIRLELIQDFFAFGNGAFGANESSWADELGLLPFTEMFLDDAPRALIRRALTILSATAPGSLVYCAAKRKSNEVGFKFLVRSGGTSDPFIEDGEIGGHMMTADLSVDLGITAVSGNTITIVAATSEEQEEIVAALPPIPSERGAGTSLLNLICIHSNTGSVASPYIGGEYCIVSSASKGSGLEVVLTGVFRAVFDTVQQIHEVAKSKVVILRDAGVNDSFLQQPIPPSTGLFYDVKLLPFGLRDVVSETSVDYETLLIRRRSNVPYNVGQISLNGIAQDTVDVSLEGTGSGDNYALEIRFVRRDYRTNDEIEALTVDAATLFPDFPSINATTYTVKLRSDDFGLIGTVVTSGNVASFKRNDILLETGGEFPDELEFTIEVEHTVDGIDFDPLKDAGWTFTVDSELESLFALGAIDDLQESNVYTATSTGLHKLQLNTTVPGGETVQVSVNGGGYTTLISAGASNGNVSLTSGDTVKIKHTISTAGFKTFGMLYLIAGTVNKAFAVLYKA